MQEEKVYLAFYKPEVPLSWWHKMVQFFDKSKYTHVEIAIPNGDTYDCYSSSHMDGGVRKKAITLKSGKWTLIELKNVNANSIRAKFKYEEGKKYDYLGLISTRLNFLPSNQNKWFCSELCAGLLGLSRPHNYGIHKIHQYALNNQKITK